MDNLFFFTLIVIALSETLLLVAVIYFFRRQYKVIYAEKQELQEILEVSSDHSDVLAADLQNRVNDKQAALTNSLKVLNCLYQVSQMIETYPQQSLEKILKEIVGLIQSTLSFSQSQVCLTIYGEQFDCSVSISNLWCNHFPIRVAGNEIGHLQICQSEANRLTEADETMSCELCVQIGNLLTRKKTNEELYRLAHADYLTRLPNRYAFNKLVSSKLNHWQPTLYSESLLAVLFLDLDRFKTINDSMGHQQGDYLLKIIAERLKSLLNSQDIVARLGGDEFIFMVISSNRLNLQATARYILDAIKMPCHVGGRDLSVSGSLGIALYPNDGNDVDSLIQHADVAMYYAKKIGRNTFQFYQTQMNARTLELLALENDLRSALERQELLLYYQPQFSLINGQLEGCEALLRWYAPGRGMVAPSEFIHLAEESGLIIPIGEWVLKKACQQLKIWHNMGYVDLKIAINVSSLQFRDDNFVEWVSQILLASELPPYRVELEITESSLIEDINAAIEKLTDLKHNGFLISIDDFGTGYSSLNYLKQLPIDKLKIDYSFVRDLAAGNSDEAIVKTIIMLGHHLNMLIVAEGVETQLQYDLLRDYGTDIVQGFFTGKPQEAMSFLSEFLKPN